MPKNKVDLGELFYKQKGRCYWCKCAMVLGGNEDSCATREHLIPQSRGGRNFVKRNGRRVRNIVAACKRCNNERRATDAHTYKSTMRRHVGLAT